MEPRVFAVLLQALQEAFQLDGWEDREGELVHLPLESGITIEIDGRGQDLVLRAELQVRVTSGEESILEQLLVGNLLGKGAGGGMLGTQNGEVVLWKRLPADLPPRSVQMELEDFSNYAEVWQKIVQGAKG